MGCGLAGIWAPGAAGPADTCPLQVWGLRTELLGSWRCTQTSDLPQARTKRCETLLEGRNRSTGNSGIFLGQFHEIRRIDFTSKGAPS